MADVIPSAELVNDVHVPLVPDLLLPAQNELFAVFGRDR
jgi:hypothetical protein